MRCPSCKEPDTRVVDSRDLDEGSVIRRRRACRICGTRVTTYERTELAKLYVVKRSGLREEYDALKLLDGLRTALARRPVPVDAPERAMEAIEAQIRASGSTEISTARIGALAMAALREIELGLDVRRSLRRALLRGCRSRAQTHLLLQSLRHVLRYTKQNPNRVMLLCPTRLQSSSLGAKCQLA